MKSAKIWVLSQDGGGLERVVVVAGHGACGMAFAMAAVINSVCGRAVDGCCYLVLRLDAVARCCLWLSERNYLRCENRSTLVANC